MKFSSFGQTILTLIGGMIMGVVVVRIFGNAGWYALIATLLFVALWDAWSMRNRK